MIGLYKKGIMEFLLLWFFIWLRKILSKRNGRGNIIFKKRIFVFCEGVFCFE